MLRILHLHSVRNNSFVLCSSRQSSEDGNDWSNEPLEERHEDLLVHTNRRVLQHWIVIFFLYVGILFSDQMHKLGNTCT